MASEVAEFFREKRVFLTGGTGFLGVSLVEKLLRCCPDVGAIYLLIRPKKGKTAEDRLPELSKNSVSFPLIYPACVYLRSREPFLFDAESARVAAVLF